MDEKQLEEIYRKYAESQGWKLNSDKKILSMLLKGQLENEKKYGYRYCTCRILTHNPEKDKLNICPCFWHKQEVREKGRCLCGLFVKK